MTRQDDPWRGTATLLVDGNNLLHALSGSAGEGPLRLLLARLQVAVPAAIRTTVLLDGAPDAGAPMRVRVRRGMDVCHAGRAGADQALVDEVARQPFLARDGTLAVTDDAELRVRLHRLGAHTQPTRWLLAVLERPAGLRGTGAGSSIGSGPPRTPRIPAEGGERTWRSGRGATRKRGNPRRGRTERG